MFQSASLSELVVAVLAHSLWQGALIAAVVGIILRMLPARRFNLRYGTALTGLLLLIVSLSVTWSVLNLPPVETPSPGPVVAVSEQQPASVEPQASSESNESSIRETPLKPVALDDASRTASSGSAPPTSPRSYASWLVLGWLTGASVMLLRGLGGFVLVRRWVTTTTTGPSLEEQHALTLLVQDLCERLRLKRLVRIVISDRVSGPAVFGVLWPVILVPAGLVSGMPVEQWQIVFAHELAHVRRYDALVNLVQMLLESLLFFNPAVWWLSRQVRIEREACCDALAAEVCGQPMSVARTLVDVAATLAGDTDWSLTRSQPVTSAQPSSLLAFAAPSPQGELTDRVQRLMEPDQTPRTRVSWLSLSMVLIALGLMAVILQKSSDIAVQKVADLLTPRERVERIARLQAETTGTIIPPAVPAVPGDEQRGMSDPPPARQKLTIVIRMEDGAMVPRELQLHSMSRSENHSNGSTLDAPKEPVAEYTLTQDYAPGTVLIGASAPGYAVTVTDPTHLFGGDPERRVELVVGKGRSVRVLFQDESGQPVPGVRVKLNSRLAVGGSSTGVSVQEVAGNDRGEVNLNHIGSSEYEVQTRVPGWQQSKRLMRFDGDAPVVWTLKKALPVSLQVVDAETGQPVSGAVPELFATSTGSSSHSYGDPRGSHDRRRKNNWLSFGETDSNGQLVLDELEDGVTYTFGIMADGYAMAIWPAKSSGTEQKVELHRALSISGRVTGDLTRLTEEKRGEHMQRRLGFDLRIIDSHSSSRWVYLEDDGRFEVTGLAWGEQLSVTPPGGQTRRWRVTQSIRDVVLEIPEPKPAPAARSSPERDVVLRLTGTAPEAPARGTLYVSWHGTQPGGPGYFSDTRPLANNEIRLKVPVDALLSFEPRELAGYFIEEMNSLKIEAGSEPQVFEIPVKPAGGAHLTVIRPDGSPAFNSFTTVFAIKAPAGIREPRRLNPSMQSSSAERLVPLPLGGRYRLLTREFNDVASLWSLSDEFAVTGAEPIVRLRQQLTGGRDFKVQVVGPDGKSAAGQEVELELGFKLDKQGFSTVLKATSDQTGTAVFRKLSLDQNVEPIEVRLHVRVPPSRFRGHVEEVEPDAGQVTVRLTAGVSARGVVVEAASGRPIPHVEVRLSPRDWQKSSFKGLIRTVTNEKGEFLFEGLDPLLYTGYVDETVPKGTVIRELPGGGAQFHYPAGVEQHQLKGGVAQPVRWEVVITPGSRLTVAE